MWPSCFSATVVATAPAGLAVDRTGVMFTVGRLELSEWSVILASIWLVIVVPQ